MCAGRGSPGVQVPAAVQRGSFIGHGAPARAWAEPGGAERAGQEAGSHGASERPRAQDVNSLVSGLLQILSSFVICI